MFAAVIAAPMSGSGKTVVTLALALAFRARGARVSALQVMAPWFKG